MHPAINHAIAKIRTNKKVLLLQIFTVFILPVTLIRFNILPINFRIPILIVWVTALLLVLYREHWSLTMLGLHLHTIRRYALAYLLFTVAGFVYILIASRDMVPMYHDHWWLNAHFIYLFFIVSLFQEIVYRGYLVPVLGKLTRSPFLVVFYNTILFTYLHVIFPNLLVGLPLAFVAGIGFAVMYVKYPNLPLIIISHAILNFFAVWYGFFVVF